jgi:hypothetical protein
LIFENTFLQKCEAASRAGFPLYDEVGSLVGRGFADVGYEIFAVLPSGQLLSLLTGQTSRILSEEERAHFFSVPDVDTLIEFLEERACTVESFTRHDSREWHIALSHADGRVFTAVGGTLSEAILTVIHEGILVSK